MLELELFHSYLTPFFASPLLTPFFASPLLPSFETFCLKQDELSMMFLLFLMLNPMSFNCISSFETYFSHMCTSAVLPSLEAYYGTEIGHLQSPYTGIKAGDIYNISHNDS
ncbi:hypothetical protein H5410_020779 [Solanum commersonii]|uniref:Uncharacterized protein n=1 Tax=Solanum commersonii TaxID=4109 RepID=A0A9J5ZA26_SOLCO|nr:hypothetical protein H5410_020779 [Solanum commersonii]